MRMAKVDLLVKLLKTVVLCSLVWALICVLAAMAGYSDILKREIEVRYLQVWWSWFFACLPYQALSILLYLAIDLKQLPMLTAKRVIWLYIWVLLSYYPLQLVFSAWLALHHRQQPFSWQGIVDQLQDGSKFNWFMDFTITSATYVAVVAVHFWLQNQAQGQAMQKAITDNLNLRLELEQQKLNSLRAQLEPHFLFNALNAISALVRSDDKKVAISALNRLSYLLRYALTASSKDWVRIQDELGFVSDYLALQQLRYGDRLQWTMHGLNDQIRVGDCPPLLLQPLVENAIRHDLDGHNGVSDILIHWQLQGEKLQICLSNPINDAQPTNPGLGLGLANTAARLALLYNDQASLRTERVNGRFVVQLDMPLYVPE